MKKLYVVGLGPGAAEEMTLRARAVLEECEILAGYTGYIDLVKDIFPKKELLSTPMRGERERCRLAVERALEGRTVGLLSSGDAGVYGMAGLVYEVAQDYPPLDIEVVPGITAACSGAALLGAPLMHDFAVISLSDLLTPWEKIEKRLCAAAEADFCICLYNPASHGRKEHLKRACDILLRYRPAENLAGLVRLAGREGEHSEILTLGQLRDREADMFTTVFIGNSTTRRIGEWMVTPRGYQKEGVGR